MIFFIMKLINTKNILRKFVNVFFISFMCNLIFENIKLDPNSYLSVENRDLDLNHYLIVINPNITMKKLRNGYLDIELW